MLEAIAELYPEAELFTLFYSPEAMPAWVRRRRVRTSWLNAVPQVKRRFRSFLPLFPTAIEALSLQGFDLVISSSHCVAKGVRIPEGARHLSYVHAPMRYMWDRFDDYFGEGRASPPVRLAAAAARPYLRGWDRRTTRRVDRLVANSHFIAGKIAEHYGRAATVIHPFIDVERFSQGRLEGAGNGGYFLWVGAFAPYKRIDLVLESFRRSGLPLWIAGSGQEAERVRRDVPPNVKLLGQVPDAELPALYRNARALVFPGEEDFGLTPLEAQAAGRPVIALARGGALETVTSETGILFAEQSVAGIEEALQRFEAFEPHFLPARARAHASAFTKKRFQDALLEEVGRLLHPSGGV